MKVTNLKGKGKLRVGRTELDVPHLGKKLTFVLPLIGPNYHETAMDKIDSQGLYRPTTAQVLSLVDLALQNKEEPYCTEILKRFKEDYLWTATESLSFENGVLVYDDIKGKMPQTSKGLLGLVDKKDERARLVNPGFKTGIMPISEFLKNPYAIAQIGENMIETAERIAKAFNKKEAFLSRLDKLDSGMKRLTAVSSFSCGVRLSLGGYYHLGGSYYHLGGSIGCVSGVRK